MTPFLLMAFREINIVSRTPFRLPLGGGGTDTDHVNRLIGGSWGAAAITLYVDVSVISREDDRIRIRISEVDKTLDSLKEVKPVHPLVYQALKESGIRKGVEITASSNISSRAGVGGSGSLVVGLLHCLWQISGRQFTKLDLAIEAYRIERALGYPIGPQDQLAAALGGIYWYTRSKKTGKVKPERLFPGQISQATVSCLEEDLLLFDTGQRHSTREVLAEEKKKLESPQLSHQALAQWEEVKELGLQRKKALINDNLILFGELLDRHCQNKLSRTEGKVNSYLKKIYEVAKENGAVGGYPIGAGKGGCFILLALGYDQKKSLRQAMTKLGLRELHWRFDMNGSQIIHSLLR